jgi:ferric-dicitrate binding protein FerR (iron transport regulator)
VTQDGIEDVLRRSGRRPSVPEERADRVRDAVRARWEGEVERRRRKRNAWIALGVAATAAGIAIGLRFRSPSVGTGVAAQVSARVEALVDAAWIHPASAPPTGAARALRLGDAIAAGSELGTPERGRVALRTGSGHSVRLDRSSDVRVVSATVLYLARGSVYVDSGGAAEATATPLTIRTPFGDVRDLGTQFEVSASASTLRVRVREGDVVVSGTASLRIGAGEEAVLSERGDVVRRDLESFGSEWSWAEEIAPPLDIDGRSAREFLEWVARERGLELRFATPELEVAAPGIVLHGSIRGMTLDQALASILPTCRMSYRIERSVLRIDSTEG